MGAKSGGSYDKDSSSDSDDDEDLLKHSDSYERSGRDDPDDELLDNDGKGGNDEKD
jgi:hypothetical protein